MTKTLLIPTDFTITSLHTLKLTLEMEKTNRIRVVLMYSEPLSDSITDLIFFRPHKKLLSNLNREFNEALEIIRNRFETKLYGNITIAGYHGTHKNALHNFLDAYRVDEIIIPTDYVFKTNDHLTDPSTILRYANRKITSVNIPHSSTQSHSSELITLFN